MIHPKTDSIQIQTLGTTECIMPIIISKSVIKSES
jgi:hypothetical protein